ncbi:MAG TPA: molybdate ABC transporter substrate-binding protein [Blastocatellia bacterium]|nr:molybdate ABC transporter substrate-binding protein [Blastocatellia bacterium]
MLALLSVGSCKSEHKPEQATITIAAAADLGPAFNEISKAFEQSTGIKAIVSLGSTGLLTKQIENGAPMDVFAAANTSYIDNLDREGLVITDTKAVYARGQITLWTRSDSKLRINKIPDLTNPELKRIAIANPDHAPYGAAARDALKTAGVWDVVQPKMVFAENIQETLQFAQTGNVDVAIVALSLSVSSNGRWILIPQELYKPIDQSVAVLKGTKHEKDARAFVQFINQPVSREIMKKYGFKLPLEQ